MAGDMVGAHANDFVGYSSAVGGLWQGYTYHFLGFKIIERIGILIHYGLAVVSVQLLKMAFNSIKIATGYKGIIGCGFKHDLAAGII